MPTQAHERHGGVPDGGANEKSGTHAATKAEQSCDSVQSEIPVTFQRNILHVTITASKALCKELNMRNASGFDLHPQSGISNDWRQKVLTMWAYDR